MKELLSMFTAFGVMIAGDGSQRPVLCQKEMDMAIERFLQSRGERLTEQVVAQHREIATNLYEITYKNRRPDGSELAHRFHVRSTSDCKKMDVKKL